MRRSNLFFWTVLVTIIEIFLVINNVAASSYFLSESSEISEERIGIEKEKNLELFNFLFGLFSIKQIGLVSALSSQELSMYEVNTAQAWQKNYNTTHYAKAEYSIANEYWTCCLETKEGAICQDLPTVERDKCSGELFPGKCEEVAECKIGCCVDESEGLCATKATKKKCEENGGKFDENPNCVIENCMKGCCVIGTDVFFTTRDRCTKLSLLLLAGSMDFRKIPYEISCLSLKDEMDLGACVIDEKICNFGTDVECAEHGGVFYKNYLCSHPDLETNCERQKEYHCVEGEDEIFWFDSCGNRENIYSADKERSWNGGYVLSKERSCNPDEDNINSDCGNCDYYLGSKCGKTVTGDYKCQDLNCVDEFGKVRKNGESWCSYDSYIGEGKDTAGSRHWRVMCIDGEIKTEPCADYRGQVCAEENIPYGNQQEDFSLATCVINEAWRCLSYNSHSNTETLCDRNKHCVMKNVDVSDTFAFDMCVPAYPRGLDLSGKNYAANLNICKFASQKCIVVYEMKLFGGLECIMNCECEEAGFAEQLNDLCISLGDCGGYINYIGKGTDSFHTKNTPEISWEDYKKYAKPVEGQHAEANPNEEDFVKFSGGAYDADLEPWEYEKSALQKGLEIYGQISGGVGIGLQLGEIVGLTSNAIFAGFGAAFSGMGIGMMAGAMVSKQMGLKGDAAAATMISGGVAGGIAGTAFWAAGTQATTASSVASFLGTGASGGAAVGGTGGAAAGGAAGGGAGALASFIAAIIVMIYILIIAIIVAVIVALIMKAMGIGEITEVEVKFDCLPWEAPDGGEDCGRCNEDPLKPCSKYRCESLGKSCQLVNEQSSNPECVWVNRLDRVPPVISFLNVSEGYLGQRKSSERIEIRMKDGNCIPEFASVVFSLETDEYAQCKWDLGRKEYDEMMGSFLEQGDYSYEHNSVFTMPSLESLSMYNLTEELQDKFREIDLYVKCKDKNGNKNLRDYMINFCVNHGFDITAPIILDSQPVNGAVLKYGVSETPLEIYVNEPADCKWSERDAGYENMENDFYCRNNLTQFDSFGWKCSTDLSGLTSRENKIYVRCKDKPWANESDRNVNVQSYEYVLHSSKSDLRIDSVTPQGEIKGDLEPISINLEVKTSGGVDEGVAICSYKLADEMTFVEFAETFSNKHKQLLDKMLSGLYKVQIECEDDAGNKAYERFDLILDLDDDAPEVVRVYYENEKLKIITDENARCYYDFGGCGFDLEGGKEMDTSFQKIHSAEWQENFVYYIKCVDEYENENAPCAIEVSAQTLKFNQENI